MSSSSKGKDPNASGGYASHDANAAGPESQMPVQSSRRPRMPSKPDIPMPVAVSFHVEGTNAEPATGFIARLSLAGVDIETFEASPPIGAHLILRTTLDPNAGPMTIRGRVQWVKDSRIGIQFATLGVGETHVILGAMAK